MTIRDLHTKLGHESLAKDEALDAAQRAETDKQTVLGTLHAVEAELAAERLARRNAEDALTWRWRPARRPRAGYGMRWPSGRHGCRPRHTMGWQKRPPPDGRRQPPRMPMRSRSRRRRSRRRPWTTGLGRSRRVGVDDRPRAATRTRLSSGRSRAARALVTPIWAARRTSADAADRRD
jgi:hypothetical protein